jgi:hypothetical protein
MYSINKLLENIREKEKIHSNIEHHIKGMETLRFGEGYSG